MAAVGLMFPRAAFANITTSYTATTFTTSSLFAQNFPSASVMGDFVVVLVFIFLVPAALVSILRESGDVAVTIWLAGSAFGGLLGSMASDAASFVSGAYGYVPWGLTFFLTLSTIVWLIKGGGH